MHDDDTPFFEQEAKRNWDRVRRKLWRERLLCVFRRCSENLISFEAVQKKLRLVQGISRGIRQIPTDRISGSVGRYKDFTSTFLPRRASMRERWERVDAYSAALGMPPISVYQVCEAYFVLDGNHRVSVARQARMPTIEAHVMEFKGPVTLSAKADLDEVLLKAEQADFLTTTNLDQLRPGHGIVFTVPGRYRQVKYYIHALCEKLCREQGCDVSYEQAAAQWYDRVYLPVVQALETSDILNDFPGRTVADLFIWMWKHEKNVGVFGLLRRLKSWFLNQWFVFKARG